MSALLLESPVGPLWLTAQGGALTGCWFVNGRFPPELPPQPPRKADDPVLAAAKAWLEIYFSGRDPGPTPPLAAKGTPFQQEVWRRLAQVPWGTATSYGALAADIAAEKGIPKMSARAVGGAVGRNPISLFLPCHRVLGADGRLTGYGGGLENKIYLLKLEGIPFRP